MSEEKKIHLVIASENYRRRDTLVSIVQSVYDQIVVLDEADSVLEVTRDAGYHLILLETDDDLAKLCHIAWSIYLRSGYAETPLLLTFASDASFLRGIYEGSGLDKELLIVQFRESFPHLAHFDWDRLLAHEVSHAVHNVLGSLRAEQYGRRALADQGQLQGSLSSADASDLPPIVIAADSDLYRQRLVAVGRELSERAPLVLGRHYEVVRLPLGRRTTVFLENYSSVPALVQTVHAWWRRHQGQAMPRFVAVVTGTSMHQNPYLMRMCIADQQVFSGVITYEQIDRDAIPRNLFP